MSLTRIMIPGPASVRPSAMIVCHCQGTTDRDIRRAAAAGRATALEVGRACGAGAGCGGCLPTIREILREQAPSPPTPTGRPADRPAA